MHSLYDFIIEPIGSRYNNKKQVGDKELILNTEIFHHQHVNREAKVISIPTLVKTEVQPGDTVIVHHNVFRRWHDMQGVEKNSKSYINEKTYAIRQGDWVYINSNSGAGQKEKSSYLKHFNLTTYSKDTKGLLFNLKEDPRQSINLFNKHPDKVNAMNTSFC